MSTLSGLSVSQLEQALAIRQQIDALERQLAAVLGAAQEPAAPAAKAVRSPVRKKRGLSAAGRARIIAAQKARWARQKQLAALAPTAPAKVETAPAPVLAKLTVPPVSTKHARTVRRKTPAKG